MRICRYWRKGERSAALGSRILSGRHDEGESCFAKAISLLENAVSYEPNLAGDLDQTRVYRAINAMDGGLADANDRVREVLGEVGPIAPPQWLKHGAEGPVPASPVAAVPVGIGKPKGGRQAYLISTTTGNQPRHPWELINCFGDIALRNRQGRLLSKIQVVRCRHRDHKVGRARSDDAPHRRHDCLRCLLLYRQPGTGRNCKSSAHSGGRQPAARKRNGG